ncbi:BTB/POZ domain-containing protein [Nymphaea thermarum]|nr:BTB/POZ domain-containing protein [Nymphaea thermarum]
MRKGSPAVGPYNSGTKFTISAHSKAIDPAKPSANNRHFEGKSYFANNDDDDRCLQSALLSRSGYLTRYEHETSGSEGSELLIDDFPCQPGVFKMVVNFCYGAGVEITAGNVAALRCAAEFMEMTESVAEGNLVAKTESFLSLVALPSWRHSFAVLRSCETLPPSGRDSPDCEALLRIDRFEGADGVGSDGWLEDLSSLRIEHFSRVVTMVAAKGGNPEIVSVSIAKYAEKRLTDGRGTATGDSELNNSSRMGLPETANEETGTSPFHNHRFLEEMRHAQIGRRKEKEKESATLHHTGSMLGLDSFGTESVTEKRRMVESLVSLLPAAKEVIDVGLLLGMLKAAMRLGAAPALVGELEKRVGMNLEKTSAEDLVSLVSGGEDGADGGGSGGCGGGNDGVEMVQRLVEYFLMQDDREGKLAVVAKILDGYLAEIAKRPDLTPARFQVIAEALPEFARTCVDGLYRAIDTYLKVVFSSFFFLSF